MSYYLGKLKILRIKQTYTAVEVELFGAEKVPPFVK
jgi:hypothetical protein